MTSFRPCLYPARGIRALAEGCRGPPRPIVLGAILDHLKTKGPAEIPTKRTFFYRIAHQRALERNVPYKAPPAYLYQPDPHAAVGHCHGPDR